MQQSPDAFILGTVQAGHRDEVHVDLAGQADGVLPADPRSADLHPGQASGVTVVGGDAATGEVRLAVTRAQPSQQWQALEEAGRTGAPVEGTVRAEVRGGLLVDVGVPAFMPASQVERAYVRDLAAYLGQVLSVRVLQCDRARHRIIVSRRALLDEEQHRRRDALWAELAEGQIREGVVKSLTDFGAFIDLGGVDGLLHVSAISWDRVEHPADVLSVGESVRVRILRLDRANQKVSLGRKQVDPDPWAAAVERYAAGNVVDGRVTRLCPFGAFVHLEAGIDGLIHISELADRPVRDPAEVVRVGEDVAVVVVRIAPDEHRLALSLRRLPSNAGAGAPEERAAAPTDGDALGAASEALRRGASAPEDGAASSETG